MEVVGACPPFGAPAGEPRSKTIKDRDTWRSMEKHAGPDGEKWVLVDVVLIGGAPWGFTLRGGLEYQEPLIITKVEEGSRAALAQLQVGDEIVSINTVPLSGYRQEAICLVKSSFKTLALGLKRKNEPCSWHSSKVSENSSEVHETEDTVVREPAWQTKRDAGSSSNNFISCWGQTNLQPVSCQFSSVGNMELLERSCNTHHIGAENLATTRSGDIHNSGYRAFSSCTPEQHLSESAASSECMFYRGSQSEHRRYLQIPVSNEGCTSPKIGDQAGSRFFSSGKLNINPVWHVPEKSSAAYSPPPPAPPLRNDSFTATKDHEKGLGIPYLHGLPVHSYQKSHSRVNDRQADDYNFSEQGFQSQHSYNPQSEKDFLRVHLSAEDYCRNELNTTKLYSLSSTDVRQGQNHLSCQPQHQRQRSDESPFYLYPRNTFAPNLQTVGIYYRSLQHIATNGGVKKQTGSATGSLSSTTLDSSSDGMANYRYYCITSDEPKQEISDGVGEHKWRPESEPIHASSDRNPANYQRAIKLKYPLTSLQAPENKSYKHTVSPPKLEASSPAILKSNSGKKEKENPWRKDGGISENQHNNSTVKQQAEQRSFSTREHKDTQNDPWISKNGHKICPQKTPLLHSLAQENRILTDSTMNTTKGCTLQEKPDPISSKQGRRSDRYATTLLNEIQEKRAQLQKSRSAATLNCPGEFEEDLGVWRSTETSTSSSDGSFTSTYKDHLKEAQARVLQATSFKRRDLELPGNETFQGQLGTKSDSTNGHVSRIGSRKRFPLDKRVHSFSEPDKINELGVEEEASKQATLGSFVDRFKFFEGASRPTFSKPIPKKSQPNVNESISGDKNRFTLLVGENDRKSASNQQFSTHKCNATAEEQQRLGTFAEYEATWNLQRKSVGGRTSSRYHSAENILDSGMEEGNSMVCIHERSRSSPSADFHGEKITLSAEKPVVEPHPEHKLHPEKIHSDSTSERGQNHLNISDPLEFSRSSDLEQRDMTQPLYSTHTTKGSCPASSHPHHLRFQASVFELSSSNKGSAEQKPSDYSENESTQLETTSSSSLSDSQQEDPHAATIPQRDRMWNNGKPLSALVPSATPKFPLPQSGGEVTAPSEFGYSQGSSISLRKLTDELPASIQYSDIHSNLMESSTEPSSAMKNIPMRIVHAEGSSNTENKQESPGDTDKGFTHQLNLPCSPEQPLSLFHAMQFSSSEDQKMDNTETMRLRADPTGLSEEDEKREELARDIMGMDKSLVDILDQSKMKTTMDLMEGIYPQGEQLLEGLQQRRKSVSKQSPKTTQEKADDKMAASASLATSSSYYSTSAPKAELLIKMKDMQEQMREQGSEDELEYDLSNKKQELIDSLSRKLQVLREARESLLEDMQDNNNLGEEVEATVQAICKPNELDKFRMFVGDLDKVVSLLLSLSGRLARVENALNNLEEGVSAEEKHTLTEKRKLLIRQHEDAKELKENLDRRERLVYEILVSYLSEDRLADYQHFVKMKSALIIEQRKLEDRIKLGEEQLKCLKDSLPLEQRLGY
ncbi:protein Shroom2 [Pangasianodon hypophthalmus]|uniref:protein Shroom2 n=1 Tax=Pangasianodon hypophthalmus TaxID=310915 RepID=UPI002307526A|nr:protein Shroom2 [Pangasianodon hypophthalmus]